MKLTQEIINEVGELPESIQLINTNKIKMLIDGNWETVTADDVKKYSGSMSGLRNFAGISGDWRMIDRIVEDATAVFERMGHEF